MKNQSEETQLKTSEPKRAAKFVPLNIQKMLLQHRLKVDRLKTDSEKIAYETGRAAAEIFIGTNPDMPTVGENANTAEDVLDVIYGAIEDGTIHLTQANQILCELKKPLELQNQQLRDKVNQSVRAK